MVHELAIRLGFFLGLLALFAVIEAAFPKRARVQQRGARWFTNLSILILGAAGLRLLALITPLLAIGAALDAKSLGWGLFNSVGWPAWLEGLIAVLFLDLAIWCQHLITHRVPLFWRFHRVHHADRDMDVTTALRFHPVEIAASMLLKIGLIYLIGPSAISVLVFEVLLNGTALFTHANLRIPPVLSRVLGWFIVTPDMHRIHHSVQRSDHDRNFGFALSLWDRLFGTLRTQPEGGEGALTIGLEWQDARPARLGWSLLLPFHRR
jgi:sterol desaturase/sphingolipid hydroxylase (fatty acid hydroxylase superfamily)